MKIYELHQQMIDAGIPIEGLDSDGNIAFLSEATSEQKEQAQQMMATWLALSEEERGMNELPSAGYTKDITDRLKKLEDDVKGLKTKSK